MTEEEYLASLSQQDLAKLNELLGMLPREYARRLLAKCCAEAAQ